MNCESDFVARTDDFQQLIKRRPRRNREGGRRGRPTRGSKDPDGPVRKRVAATIGKLGENMAVPRFVRYAGTGLRRAVHPHGRQDRRPGGVRRRARRRSAAAKSSRRSSRKSRCRSRPPVRRYASREATCRPMCSRRKESIYRAQMENSGKPAQRHRQDRRRQARKLLPAGRAARSAESIRDPKMTVKDVLAAANKALGASVADHAVRAAEGRRRSSA